MKTLIDKQNDRGAQYGIIHDGRALLDIARGWLKQGNCEVPLELLRTALRSKEAKSDQLVRAQVLKETGRALMMKSDWENSEPYYIEAQQSFLEMENYKGASECARNRANMYFQKGDFAHSRELCEEALELASISGNHELRASILNTMAAISSATGEYQDALKMFRLCLADFQAAGNIIRQGYVLLNIGLAHVELNQHDEAISRLNESLAIALEERDLQLVEICYQNISRCYLAQNELVLAQSVSEVARKILPGLNSTALKIELDLIDGKILRTMGSYSSAEVHLEKTLKDAVDHQLTGLQPDILFEQGLVFRDLGKRDVAVSKLNAAARLYRQIGNDGGFKESTQLTVQLNNRVRTVQEENA